MSPRDYWSVASQWPQYHDVPETRRLGCIQCASLVDGARCQDHHGNDPGSLLIGYGLLTWTGLRPEKTSKLPNSPAPFEGPSRQLGRATPKAWWFPSSGATLPIGAGAGGGGGEGAGGGPGGAGAGGRGR